MRDSNAPYSDASYGEPCKPGECWKLDCMFPFFELDNLFEGSKQLTDVDFEDSVGVKAEKDYSGFVFRAEGKAEKAITTKGQKRYLNKLLGARHPYKEDFMFTVVQFWHKKGKPTDMTRVQLLLPHTPRPIIDGTNTVEVSYHTIPVGNDFAAFKRVYRDWGTCMKHGKVDLFRSLYLAE